jgi:hypothetical protein
MEIWRGPDGLINTVSCDKETKSLSYCHSDSPNPADSPDAWFHVQIPLRNLNIAKKYRKVQWGKAKSGVSENFFIAGEIFKRLSHQLLSEVN